MIRRGTNLAVFDNSSIKFLKCLTVVRRVEGTIGDLIYGVVKREFYNKRSFRKRFFFGLIMSTKRTVFRNAGAYYIRFPRSGVLLLKEDRESFFGTRFNVRVPLEIRKSGFNDICVFSRKTI
jgi:ribosomal protein L14